MLAAPASGVEWSLIAEIPLSLGRRDDAPARGVGKYGIKIPHL